MPHSLASYNHLLPESTNRSMSPAPKIAVISIEGINFSSGFILKELSIRVQEEASTRHYVFNRPADLQMTAKDSRTESYCKRVLGAAGINDYTIGSLDYYTHVGILYSLANHTIYCAGHVAHKFLSNLLPYTCIYDIQDIATHVFPKELPSAWCGLNHNPRYCSLAKLWNMVHFVQAELHQ